ncbi:MAG TPA: hypothetical protein DGP39_07735 [Verrucomicrobiales bacterium]|nr:hypothetical protein [Verrucomicrobiales bacterium]
MKARTLIFLLSFVSTALQSAELIRVPLHIHYLKSTVPEVNAPKDGVDTKELLKEVNQIWKPADIEFFIKQENIVQADEKAAKAYADLFGMQKIAFQTQSNRQLNRAIPDLKNPVFHVVFLHTMPLGFGGRYFPDRGFVLLPQMKYAKHGNFPGGKFPSGDTKRPLEGKVFAHELGHAMSLMHGVLENNLMTSGPKARGIKRGTELVEKQILGARKIAVRGRPFLRKESELATRTDTQPQEPLSKPQTPPTNTSRRPVPPWVRVMTPEQRRHFSDLMREHRQEFEKLGRKRSEARQRMNQALFTDKPDEKAVLKASQEAAATDARMALLNRKLIGQVKPPLNDRQLEEIRKGRSSNR